MRILKLNEIVQTLPPHRFGEYKEVEIIENEDNIQVREVYDTNI